MLGIGAFKKHTSMLRTMSEAYVENRGVYVRCAYNKARNDYIKTRDSITDSIVFHFEDDEDVYMGDILAFNSTYYLLSNLVPDTFFHVQMRKRAAGIELYYIGNIYSIDTEYIETEGQVMTGTLKYENVRFAIQKDVMDGERTYILPYDSKNCVISCIYENVELGDMLRCSFGNFYIKDIDEKLPGGKMLMLKIDSRDVTING